MHWAAYDFELSSIDSKLRFILARICNAMLYMCRSNCKSTITVDQLIDTLSYMCDDIAQYSLCNLSI